MQGGPLHTPPASNPSAQHTAASLLRTCSKALALACAFIGGFLGRTQLNLVVTVGRGQGWEHVMDAICVLLVGLSCAKVTCTAPCLCWAWGFPPCRRHRGSEVMWGNDRGHSKICCSPGHPLVGSQASASCLCTYCRECT